MQKLFTCTNSIIDIFMKELQNLESLKNRKDIISQLEKLTTLVIKLNKVKNNTSVETEKLEKKDEEIIKALLEEYKGTLK